MGNEVCKMARMTSEQGSRIPAVKRRAFSSPLARGFYPRSSRAEVDHPAKLGTPADSVVADAVEID